MSRLVDLPPEEARAHFLDGDSYFNSDIPKYIRFKAVLDGVAEVMNGKQYTCFESGKPDHLSGVNYSLIANKDGRFDWRPFELIHPAIYVSLVNVLCDPKNWEQIQARWAKFESSAVQCCSDPVLAVADEKNKAAQVRSWWQRVEQQSLIYSLEYSHVLHTDVTNCYGSLYTHSIPWAIHGLKKAKQNKFSDSLLGNRIDAHMRAGRHGQTNGIPQGSVLMDFVAEIVLGYVDEKITSLLDNKKSFRILRYRDDYRVFANSDETAEEVLKKISDSLRSVGMRLGAAKTHLSRNVVEGSIKPDKLAGIDLLESGEEHVKTLQKKLLRLHSFGRRFPNSGALRRLVSEFYDKIVVEKDEEIESHNLDVQVAIATDIGFVSPNTFPVVAAILSRLISLASPDDKVRLWTMVRDKMRRLPHNGYQEIWLQRVTHPKAVDIKFESREAICQIVNGESPALWENGWIACPALLEALQVAKIVDKQASDMPEVMQPEEVELFRRNAWLY